MRQRDLLVLLTCGLGIFLSFQRDEGDGFRIRRAWSYPLDHGHYADGSNPQPHEKLPPPLVTDVDGDGEMDVVLVTKEPSIKLIEKVGLLHRTGKKGDFQQASARYEATLLSSIVRLSAGRQPAALASGYIDPPPKDPITLRRQVIVVVTQDWTVLCFDEKLKLMWESNLQDFVPDDFYHREIAISITPVGVFKGDRGMVIVAGSARHELTVGGDEYWEEHEAEAAAEAAGAAPGDPTKIPSPVEDVYASTIDDEEDELENPQDELLVEQDIHHFSYYAVEGGRGGLRWSHEAGDYETTVMDEDNNLSPQHNYKLDVQSNEQHQDEVDWRQYRDSVLHSLPHSWRRRDDTWLELKHFARQKRQKPVAPDSNAADSLLYGAAAAAEVLARPLSAGGSIGGSGLSGTTFGPVAPPPNVIVAHRADGLDVVHLFSGRLLCQVRLMQGTHADVNRDGTIDHMYALAGHDLASRSVHDRVAAGIASSPDLLGSVPSPGCMAIATSGVPVHDHLFNASICPSQKDRSFQGTTKGWQSGSPGPLDAVDPVVMPSIAHPGGSGKLDTVFLLSNGRVTSVGPSGERNWQVQTSAVWQKAHIMLATGGNHEAGLRPDSVAVPSLRFVNLHAEKNAEEADDEDLQLLAVGDSNLVFLSMDGRVRASIGLTQQPVGTPTLGDFNDDGVVRAKHKALDVPHLAWSALTLVIVLCVWCINLRTRSST